MIADDDPGISHITALVLRKSGYGVVTVENGVECLARMRQGFRGVILMDVAMPQLDGWETIRAMRAEGLLDHSLVCMLTGREPLGDEAGLEDCVVDYLTKPFTSNALLEVVSSAFALMRS